MYLTVWSKPAKFYWIMVIAVRLGFGSLFGAEKQKKSVGFFWGPFFPVKLLNVYPEAAGYRAM